MTYPRAHLIDADNGGVYHLRSRCVRRAFLCGQDPVTGRSFEHRKRWLEQRVLTLASVYSVQLIGYAIMSNHYHLIVRSHPQGTQAWSDEEVARRWDLASFSQCAKRKARTRAELLANPQRMKEIRRRLGDISSFMGHINEPMARMINREDDCTGRAWEGRFRSSALLDDPAVLRCMVYVDLNPVRAGITDIPTQAPHTSLKRRWTHPEDPSPLVPLSVLSLTLSDYAALVDWTAALGRTKSLEGTDSLPGPPVPIEATPAHWKQAVESHRARYRAYGHPRELAAYTARLGQRWIKTAPSVGPPMRRTEAHTTSDIRLRAASV